MKATTFLFPLLLATIAAVGNALATLGQKKSSGIGNPFIFGATALLIAGFSLLVVAFIYQPKNNVAAITANFKWAAVTASGLVMLNVFLYVLYRQYGANFYTLYSMLAIITTSILLSVFIFNEKMNTYYGLSLIAALVSIFFFFKGRIAG